MKRASEDVHDAGTGVGEIPDPAPIDYSTGADSVSRMKELAEFLKSVAFDDGTDAILEEKVDSFSTLYPDTPRDELKEILRKAIEESHKESKGGRKQYWCKECDVPKEGHLCAYPRELKTTQAPKQKNKNKPRLFDEAGKPKNRCGFCCQQKKLSDGSDHKIVCKYCKYCGHLKLECIRSGTCPKAKTWIDCREKWDG